jgi:hypothetical protein
MDQMGQRFGPEAYRRFTEAYRHVEHIHHQCMAGPHWYLALLGVSPRRQGQGIGRARLTPVLQRADQEALPCYLETFVSGNVPFDERRGFRVVDAGVEPQSRVAFWAMKREPHAAQERRFSSDAEPGNEGPRRVSRQELYDTFAEGWEVESVQPARCEVHPEFTEVLFSEGGPKVWFAVVRRKG